jgi:hypothetical protein
MVFEKTGVLVIRAWIEQGLDQTALRARITWTLDISAPEPFETLASTEQEIVSTVQAWLRAFTDAATVA